jgi:hypothetical protein
MFATNNQSDGRYRFAYFLKQKIILPDLEDLLLNIRKLGAIWKWMKTDNGGEFINADVRHFMQRNGIEHETTAPHTPHQNGVAERTNRTVCELAVATMLSSGTPPFLWPYAIRFVVYVTQRFPTVALDMRSTSYVNAHREIPDVSRIRTFGCDAYSHLPDNQRDSFGARAVKGLHVGVDEQSLSYLFYNPATRRVTKTGHICFNEDLSEKSVTVTAYEEIQQLKDGFVHSPDAPDTDVEDLMNDQTSTAPSTTRSHSGPIAPVSSPSDQPADSDDTMTVARPDSSGFHSLYDRVKLRRRNTAAYLVDSVVSVQDAASAFYTGRYFDHRFANMALQDTAFEISQQEFIEYGPDLPDSPTEVQALGGRFRLHWLQAMRTEIENLARIDTFTRVTSDQLPSRVRTLKHKWVFKMKFVDGRPTKFKARLTAKGCNQRPGVDFNETFSPVARITTIRFLIAYAAANNMIFRQADVTNAFPNAALTETIYLDVTGILEDLLVDIIGLKPGARVKLSKALYGKLLAIGIF